MNIFLKTTSLLLSSFFFLLSSFLSFFSFLFFSFLFFSFLFFFFLFSNRVKVDNIGLVFVFMKVSIHSLHKSCFSTPSHPYPKELRKGKGKKEDNKERKGRKEGKGKGGEKAQKRKKRRKRKKEKRKPTGHKTHQRIIFCWARQRN